MQCLTFVNQLQFRLPFFPSQFLSFISIMICCYSFQTALSAFIFSCLNYALYSHNSLLSPSPFFLSWFNAFSLASSFTFVLCLSTNNLPFSYDTAEHNNPLKLNSRTFSSFLHYSNWFLFIDHQLTCLLNQFIQQFQLVWGCNNNRLNLLISSCSKASFICSPYILILIISFSTVFFVYVDSISYIDRNQAKIVVPSLVTNCSINFPICRVSN